MYRCDGRAYSTADGSTQLLASKQYDSSDTLGAFRGTDLLFGHIIGTTSFVGRVKQYDSFIEFEQIFPDSLRDTSSGNADALVTTFPAFRQSPDAIPDAYAHWVSWYYDANPPTAEGRRRLLVAPGFSTPVFGRWETPPGEAASADAADVLPGGMGGSGVTAFFSSRQPEAVTAVVSALAHPMAVSHASSGRGEVRWGVMGNATHLPTSLRPSVLLHFDGRGLGVNVMSWGALLQKFNARHENADGDGARAPTQRSRSLDPTLQLLGYSTDNGMFYYYHTANNESASYEDTLLAVHREAQAMGLPYAYMLLDSWWYYKGSNGGVSDWSPRPEIFPRGIEYLAHATGLYMQLHNRYWAIDNVYADTYHFLADPVNNGSVPLERTFWDMLLDRKAWNLAVYEQDWLFNEVMYNSALLQDVHMAQRWLDQMHDAAQMHGITIQYCMPFVRHMLSSPRYPHVTQIRASDDYVASPYEGVDNWRIGGQSLVIYALGKLPSKDGFWSRSYQPGNPYGEERFEPHVRLQAAVASLSAGPVQIGDGLGFSDVKIIRKAIDQDGRLLFPSKSATPLDMMFGYNAVTDNFYRDAPQEIWAAQSHIPLVVAAELQAQYSGVGNSNVYSQFYPAGAQYLTYSFVLGVDVAEDVALTAAMLGYAHGDDLSYIAREHNNTASAAGMQSIGCNNALQMKACGQSDFQLYTISPVLPSQRLVLLGESDKWVSVSEQRFVSILINSNNELSYELRGGAGETLSILFLDQMAGNVLDCTYTFPQQAVQRSVERWKIASQMTVSFRSEDGVCKTSEV
eukprot:gene27945-33744_t